MTRHEVSFEKRARLYWVTFAIGLLLVVVLDVLTTIVATTQHGLDVESNPVMRWLLLQGPVVLAAVHVTVVVVVVILFSRVLDIVQQASTPNDRYLELTVRIWLGLLVVAGLFVVTNNLFAIFLDMTLL